MNGDVERTYCAKIEDNLFWLVKSLVAWPLVAKSFGFLAELDGFLLDSEVLGGGTP